MYTLGSVIIFSHDKMDPLFFLTVYEGVLCLEVVS